MLWELPRSGTPRLGWRCLRATSNTTIGGSAAGSWQRDLRYDDQRKATPASHTPGERGGCLDRVGRPGNRGHPGATVASAPTARAPTRCPMPRRVCSSGSAQHPWPITSSPGTRGRASASTAMPFTPDSPDSGPLMACPTTASSGAQTGTLVGGAGYATGLAGQAFASRRYHRRVCRQVESEGLLRDRGQCRDELFRLGQDDRRRRYTHDRRRRHRLRRMALACSSRGASSH